WDIDGSGICPGPSKAKDLHVVREQRKQCIEAAVCFVLYQVAIADRRLLEVPCGGFDGIYFCACHTDLTAYRDSRYAEEQRKRLSGYVVRPLERAARILRNIRVFLNLQ